MTLNGYWKLLIIELLIKIGYNSALLTRNTNMIESMVKNFIQQHPRKKYIIAYSGGVDSQVLLHAFAKVVPNQVVAFHINHGISEQADAWTDFCFLNACLLGVKFEVKKFSLKGISNLEDVARQARYGEFLKVMNNDTALVTGHHMDDQVETFMLNLMRGAGLDGLAAMPESKSFGEGVHLRPFLAIGKQDLTDYAVKNNLKWVEDESNKDSVYDRNFIRNEIMPLIKTRWENASSAVCQSINHIQNAKNYIDEKNDVMDINKDTLSITELLSFNAYEQTHIVRKWVSKKLGKSASQNMLNTIFNEIIPAREDAKMKWEQKNYFITRYEDSLYFVKKEKKSYDIAALLKSANIDLSVDDVTVNERVNGAVIKMGEHHKKVKKLFNEMHIPTWERENIPFIYHGDVLVSVGGIINNTDYIKK